MTKSVGPRTAGAAVFLALAALGACATSGEPEVVARGTRTEMIFDRGRGASVGAEPEFAGATTIDAPVEEVWKALLVALPEVGVSIHAIDEPNRTVGTEGMSVRRRLDGQRLSTFLTCGGSAAAVDVADTHVVTLSVLSTLTPEAGGTRLHTRVAGEANDRFTSVPARTCVTRGRLEARVDSAVRAVLTGG